MKTTMMSAAELREQLADIRSIISDSTWDLYQFCRFLSLRVPAKGEVSGNELARQAEELIADLKRSRDSRTGNPFVPPLLHDRADVIYNYMRERLVDIAGKIADAEYAGAVEAGLSPVSPAKAAAAGGDKAEAEPPAASPAAKGPVGESGG